MKAFLVCVLLATFVALSFAHHLELCDKNDVQLKSELQCIRRSISAAAIQSFDNAARDLRCRDNSCVIRRLCVGNDLEKAMAKYFTRAQITEFRNASAACGFNLTSDERSS
ncbi:antimicrobial peptide microplusin-like isoform X1 [Amblyomma americanum]